MVLALCRTLVGGGGGHTDFIVVMGAKLLNCSILCCTHNPCAPPVECLCLDGVVYKVDKKAKLRSLN
jgi:hypothetical protein